MNVLGIVNLFLFILIAPAAFALIRSIRGVMLIIAFGWLTLSPRAGFAISGLPELTKDFAVSYGVVLGVLLFRADLIRRFRFRWVDLFALTWVAVPGGSSLVNGLGIWDAGSEMYGQFFRWGVLYLLGRVMIRNLDDMRDCALGVVAAGLIAAPLCLLEIRMSPLLHRSVYGVHQTAFHMAVRLGGYRPMLMFRHGIEVGSWMACATAVSCWFTLCTPRAKFWSMPHSAITCILGIVTLLCRSLGSIALLFGTVGLATAAKFSRIKGFLLILILATPSYVTLRVSGLWSPQIVADIVEQYVDPARARSLQGRITQEIELGEKAADRPLLGWGGHNRFRVFDDYGEQTTAVDALWLIAYGKHGTVGLVGLYGMLCVPAFLIVQRTPVRLLLHPNMAGVVGLILALAVATGDSLQNAFFSPLMMVAAGALATTAVSLRSWLPRPAPRNGVSPPPPPPRSAP